MRDKILQAACEIIQEHGLRKFRMDDICSNLKISKKTIY
ncbi:TetR family transcriptional regulator, partial [Clostridium neonatale]